MKITKSFVEKKEETQKLDKIEESCNVELIANICSIVEMLKFNSTCRTQQILWNTRLLLQSIDDKQKLIQKTSTLKSLKRVEKKEA